ncbi:MAG: YlxM family DNA-binding protein [Oscillospiraceae bacterium]|nr:YlxM family DNA-binding protein [Oscillospiraceae bacterium]
MSGKTLEMTLLYDFYSELLTEKQREYFDLYYNDDLSLGEIADSVGITRQGVRDMIVRAEGTLRATEEKLGLVRRFVEMRDTLEAARAAAAELRRMTCGAAAEKCEELMGILGDLKG